jgi:hypothetical protein
MSVPTTMGAGRRNRLAGGGHLHERCDAESLERSVLFFLCFFCVLWF